MLSNLVETEGELLNDANKKRKTSSYWEWYGGD